MLPLLEIMYIRYSSWNILLHEDSSSYHNSTLNSTGKGGQNNIFVCLFEGYLSEGQLFFFVFLFTLENTRNLFHLIFNFFIWTPLGNFLVGM